MDMKTFRPYDPEQLLLLPPAIQDWLPEGHLARFVSEVVDELDLSAIEGSYVEERGYPPYHPRMMTKILLYGYCTGTYSSRRLAEKLVDSVAFRYLAAGNRPEAEAREKALAEGKDAEKARPPDKAQRNFTDPESKIQKTRDGYIQGYNAQVAVDELHQVIVAQQVSPSSPDVDQLLPVVQEVKRVLRRKPKQVVADAGYWSEDNVRGLEKDKIEVLIATRRQKHDEPLQACPLGRPPAGLTAKQRMERKLRTKRGRKAYARRKAIVEAPFGQIKHGRGFRQFLRRGLACVQQEWALIATAHNLLKLRTAW
jgi:hypothetical protein